MRDRINKAINKIIRFLVSGYFFWGIIALFVFQAVWIALSFRYSMIYDEYYHFGLIEYFSHQWLPWINNQPTSLDIYGSLERNPYLLFHYLLSFPFRLVALFTDNFAAQVISMRIVNIGLFTAGLVAFNRLFKEMKIRAIFRNITLLFFVLLPVTPFVAATVNYDNAIFLLTALFMIIGLKIVQSDTVRWHNYLLILLIGMSGSLMKVSFSPIFAACVLFISINQILKYKKKIIEDIKKSFISSSMVMKIAVLVPLAIVGFLFIERFAVNIIQYRSLSPNCIITLNKDRCLSNYIESRSEDLIKARTGEPMQISQYTATWIIAMESGLLATGSNTDGIFGTEVGQPLPIIYAIISIVGVLSLAAVFYSFDRLSKIPGFWLYVSIVVLYVAALFYINMSSYYKYYQPIAIQGRYLLPLLPVIMLFLVVGLNNTIKYSSRIKLVILLITFVFFMNGAGITTHIIRSDESWNWDNQTVRQINNNTREIIRPLVKEWWYER